MHISVVGICIVFILGCKLTLGNDFLIIYIYKYGYNKTNFLQLHDFSFYISIKKKKENK